MNIDIKSEDDYFDFKEGDPCPICGGTLVSRHSSRGDFLGCSNFPTCEFVIHSVTLKSVRTLLSVNKQCPQCMAPLEVKKGRFGIFIGCSNYPDCNYIYNPQEEASIECPICKHGHIVKRRTSKGRAFYGCNNYPECKFTLQGKPILKACKVCGFPMMFLKKGKNTDKEVCANSLCKSRRKRRLVKANADSLY